MHRLLLILFSALLLSACNGLPAVDTPEQITRQVERAAESRATLWDALQQDKDLFTANEWQQASAIHDHTITLAADLEVGLTSGGPPPPAEVDEWMLLSGILYDDAETLLQPRLPDLSAATRAAWAIEKARLRSLLSTAQRYLDNPDAQTYRRLARIGLQIAGAVL